jgi:hypothetical protein
MLPSTTQIRDHVLLSDTSSICSQRLTQDTDRTGRMRVLLSAYISPSADVRNGKGLRSSEHRLCDRGRVSESRQRPIQEARIGQRSSPVRSVFVWLAD